MKILMVGVGYVGAVILKELQNEEIYIATTSPHKVPMFLSQAKEVALIHEGQIEIPSGVEAVICTVAPHRGASYEKTYLQTACQLVTALKKFPLTHLIYTSSTSVYEGHVGVVTEETPLAPFSSTTKILQQTEETILSHPCSTVLRLGGIFGPGREIASRAAYFSGKEMPTDGSEPTHHIEVHDVSRAVLFCLHHRWYGVYNLTCRSHPTRKELYDPLTASPPIWSTTTPGKGYLVFSDKIRKCGFTFIHEEL